MTTKREELAWAAGFFDGEGTFCVSPNKVGKYTYYYFRFSLPQTNIEPLERFKRAVMGLGKIYGPYTKPRSLGKKPQWVWSITKSSDAIKVYNLLKEFLSTPKRNQGELAINKFHEMKQPRRKGYQKETCKNGHDYSNSRPRKNGGGRYCLDCEKIWKENKKIKKLGNVL